MWTLPATTWTEPKDGRANSKWYEYMVARWQPMTHHSLLVVHNSDLIKCLFHRGRVVERLPLNGFPMHCIRKWSANTRALIEYRTHSQIKHTAEGTKGQDNKKLKKCHKKTHSINRSSFFHASFGTSLTIRAKYSTSSSITSLKMYSISIKQGWNEHTTSWWERGPRSAWQLGVGRLIIGSRSRSRSARWQRCSEKKGRSQKMTNLPNCKVGSVA